MRAAVYPAPGTIKRIQRGTITINSGVNSNTAAITAVNTAKCELRFLGSASDNAIGYCNVTLSDSTTITATKSGATGIALMSWELTEWY